MVETGSFSDIMPGGSSFLDGEYGVEGGFTLRRTHSSTVGDLQRAEYTLETSFGSASYAILAGRDYVVNWGRYALEKGLSYFAELSHPFMELHFQLQGEVRSNDAATNRSYELHPGSANLFYVPPGSSEFAIDMDSEGSVFEIQLSTSYFRGLAERYPHLLGSFLENTLREENFYLSGEPVPMSSEMWGVIERIRHRDDGGAAGSLFYESQVLELLSLLLEQRRRPDRRNGHPIKQDDKEKLYAARDLLVDQMTDPPSLAEIARTVGTNEFTLKRGFKTLFGTSPHAFALARKLETARAYVLDTDLTISEIAYRVGYSHPAHLTNAFRKRYGMPPSALRS